MQALHRHQPTFAGRYPVSLVVALSDLVVMVLSGFLSYAYRFNTLDMSGRYNSATVITAIITVACFALGGVYGSKRGVSLWRQIGILLICSCVAAVILLSLPFLLKVSEVYSRIWFVGMFTIGVTCSLAVRVMVYYLLRRIRASGHNLKNVLIIASDGRILTHLRDPQALREDGFKLVHEMSPSYGEEAMSELVEAVEVGKAHEVWLCLPLSEGGFVHSILYALRHHTVAVRFIPDLNDIRLLNHKVSHIAGLYSLDLSCSPMDGPARILKRVEDLLIGGLISLFILPVCLVIALVIKLSSPGPVLFKQHRTGINGKAFKVYKFRSMSVHEDQDVKQAVKGDKRVTRVGAFLRRSSLDELPQFFNVLQGRMSIVGPRPHALLHNEHYKELVESYMQRHKVKPGITGWAQVSGYRGETDTLEKMQKRVEYDLWYIDNWSLWLDIKIILLTVFKGFFNKNAY